MDLNRFILATATELLLRNNQTNIVFGNPTSSQISRSYPKCGIHIHPFKWLSKSHTPLVNEYHSICINVIQNRVVEFEL